MTDDSVASRRSRQVSWARSRVRRPSVRACPTARSEAGKLVDQFTYDQVVEHPSEVVSQTARALGR
jgi:hypothetical protein